MLQHRLRLESGQEHLGERPQLVPHHTLWEGARFAWVTRNAPRCFFRVDLRHLGTSCGNGATKQIEAPSTSAEGRNQACVHAHTHTHTGAPSRMTLRDASGSPGRVSARMSRRNVRVAWGWLPEARSHSTHFRVHQAGGMCRRIAATKGPWMPARRVCPCIRMCVCVASPYGHHPEPRQRAGHFHRAPSLIQGRPNDFPQRSSHPQEPEEQIVQRPMAYTRDVVLNAPLHKCLRRPRLRICRLHERVLARVGSAVPQADMRLRIRGVPCASPRNGASRITAARFSAQKRHTCAVLPTSNIRRARVMARHFVAVPYADTRRTSFFTIAAPPCSWARRGPHTKNAV